MACKWLETCFLLICNGVAPEPQTQVFPADFYLVEVLQNVSASCNVQLLAPALGESLRACLICHAQCVDRSHERLTSCAKPRLHLGCVMLSLPDVNVSNHGWRRTTKNYNEARAKVLEASASAWPAMFGMTCLGPEPIDQDCILARTTQDGTVCKG
eukprot:1574879-Amphidinium_carterae.1